MITLGFLPDLGFEEQGLAPRQPGEAVMVFHHFGLDQLALAFDLQGHASSRAQRPNIPHLRRMVIFQFMA